MVLYEKDFKKFKRRMLRLGFREVTLREKHLEIMLSGAIPPVPKKGNTKVFVYHMLNMAVVVCSTYLGDEKQTRENDSGKVFIREEKQTVYYGTELKRTKTFFNRLYTYALAAKEHVDARPLCAMCGQLMYIYQRRGSSRQCFWYCKNPSHEGRGPFVSWEYGLSEKTLRFLHPKWKRAIKYYAKLRIQGKEPGTARTRKKRWKYPQRETARKTHFFK